MRRTKSQQGNVNPFSNAALDEQILISFSQPDLIVRNNGGDIGSSFGLALARLYSECIRLPTHPCEVLACNG